jgi:hypothetical protein
MVTVTDSQGASGSSTFQVQASNVTPTLQVSGAGAMDEGSAYTLVLGPASDPGADTVTQYLVYWGDGTSTQHASAGSVTHVYDDGPAGYTVTVDLVDEDGTHVDAGGPLGVLVNNVAPTATVSGASTATAGSTYTVTLSAADPGQDAVGLSINWGDGTAEPLAAGATSASHTYTSAGAVTVTLTATDSDNAVGTATLGVQVAAAQSLQQQISSIAAGAVNQLVSIGAISNLQGAVLKSVLNVAAAYVAAGDPTRAVAPLRAFSAQVSYLVQRGRLSAAVGQPLVDAAEAIIEFIL